MRSLIVPVLYRLSGVVEESVCLAPVEFVVLVPGVVLSVHFTRSGWFSGAGQRSEPATGFSADEAASLIAKDGRFVAA